MTDIGMVCYVDFQGHGDGHGIQAVATDNAACVVGFAVAGPTERGLHARL